MNNDPASPSSVFARRRQALGQWIARHGGGIAVLYSGAEVMRNRDSDYPYRWDSYFYYLTGFPEPDAALVIQAQAGTGRIESTLFCRPKNPDREIWDGFRFGPEAARTRFGMERSASIEELDAQLPPLLADQASLGYLIGADAALDARVQRWLASVRAQSRAGVSAPMQMLDLRAPLDEMRLVKDGAEQSVMRQAAEISAQAHVRAMRTTRPGLREFEVEAELLHEFRRQGSQFPAYGSIVAAGANACVLHYRANDAVLRDGELLLIDAGCELDGYASDITRTFPVNGRFSGAQRDLYQLVLKSQHAAFEQCRPGKRFNDPHDAAVDVLVRGMIDLGLLQGSVDAAMESGSYRRFYMHRTSHWLGMDVHDCGEYREPSSPDAPDADAQGDAKPWRILRPGMVLTIEPGIYVRAADDVPPAFHDIGIRIEDDALIDESGCAILTTGVPTGVEEIEALMRER